MGLFLAMPDVAETNRDDVAETLCDYAALHSGTFELVTTDNKVNDDDSCSLRIRRRETLL
jgi:hypothetical protein